MSVFNRDETVTASEMEAIERRNADTRKKLETPGLFTGASQLWKLPASGFTVAAGSLAKTTMELSADANEAFAGIAYNLTPGAYGENAEQAGELYQARERWSMDLRQKAQQVAATEFGRADAMYDGPQGAGTQMIRGIGEMVPRAAVGFAAAGPLGGFFALGKPEGDRTEVQLLQAGVNVETASQAGTISTVAMGGMSLLPASGFAKPLLADLGLAVGGNVAIGAAQREALRRTLESENPELAAQYNWNDPGAIAMDALLTAGFFGVSRYMGANGLDAEAKADLVDDALVVKADAQTKSMGEMAPVAAADKQAARRNKESGIAAILNDKPMPEPEPVNAVEVPEVVAQRTAVADAVAEAIRTGDLDGVRLFDDLPTVETQRAGDAFDQRAGALIERIDGTRAAASRQSLYAAVEFVESRGDVNAVSPKGAVGPMQTMPETLRDPGYGVRPAKDGSVAELRRVGEEYLDAMTGKYGMKGGLAAYNWGPGNWEAALKRAGGDVEKALASAPAETRAYVPKVLARLAGSVDTYPNGVPKNLPEVEADVADLNSQLSRFAAQGADGSARRHQGIRAIDQGLLPVELADSLSAIDQALGTKTAVVRNSSPEIRDFNGVTLGDGRIFVNEDTPHPVVTVAMHEFGHNLETRYPDLYEPLRAEIQRQSADGLAFFKFDAKIADDAVAVRELTNNAIGDALSDPQFLRRMADENPTVFQRVATTIMEYLDSLLEKVGYRSERYLEDVAVFRDMLAATLTEYNQRTAGFDENAALLALADEIGWDQQGGQLVGRSGMDDGVSGQGGGFQVSGRTKWIPRARRDGAGLSDFWTMRPDGITEKVARSALDKLKTGKKLGSAEQRFIDYAKKQATIYEAERQQAFADYMAAEQRRRTADEVFFSDKGPSLGDGVVRYDADGDTPSFDKPHGIYTTPASVDSPHQGIGGNVSKWRLNPRAKVLSITVTDGKSLAMRRDAVGAGGGVAAVRELLGSDTFSQIKGMSKVELIDWIVENTAFGREIFSRYYDAQEVMEGLGGMLARANGYDSISYQDRTPFWGSPEFDEVILLTKDSVLSNEIQFSDKLDDGLREPENASPDEAAAYAMARANPAAPVNFGADIDGNAVTTMAEAVKVIEEQKIADIAKARRFGQVVERVVAGKTLTDAEAKVSDTIAAKWRELAQQGKPEFMELSKISQLQYAAEMAGKDAEMLAAKEAQRRAANLLAQQDNLKRIAERAKELKPGLIDKYITGLQNYHDAVFERLGQVFSRIQGEQHAARSQFIEVLEATSPKFLGLVRNTDAILAFAKEVLGENSGNAEAKKAAGVYLDAIEKMRLRANSLGMNIGKLPYGWLPHQWDQGMIAHGGKSLAERAALKAAGKPFTAADARAGFVRDMLEHTDLTVLRNEDGTVMDLEDATAFYEASFDTLFSDGRNKGEAGGRGTRASKYDGKHRVIHFKNAESYMAMMDKYGGGQDLLSAIMGHLDSLAKDIAMLDELGSNPGQTVELLKATAERMDNKPGATSQGATLDMVFSVMNGEVSTPVNATIAQFGQATRNWVTATALQSVMLSSITDAPLQQLVIKSYGLDLGKNLKTSLGSFGGDTAKEAARLGIVTDYLANEMALWGQDNAAASTTGKLAEATMRLTGVNRWTHSMRRGAELSLAMGITDWMAKPWAELEAKTLENFRQSGVTEADWAIWQRAVPIEFKGQKVLDFKSIMAVDDPGAYGAAMRYLGMLDDFGKIAVYAPDVRVRAALTQGTKAGTIGGELMRSMTLFKSFALGMPMRHLRRMRQMDGKSKAQYAAFYLMGLTAFGALSIQLGMIASGKDPQDMSDEKFWVASVAKGGGLGILYDVIYNGVESEGRTGRQNWRSLSSPVFGRAADAIELGTEGVMATMGSRKHEKQFREHAARFVSDNIPFSKIWWYKQALDQVVGHEMREAISPGYMNKQLSRERKYGETRYLKPNGDVRAPDLDKAMGE